MKNEPQARALKSGSLDYNGPLQFYAPKPIILATNAGDGEASYTTRLRIPTPDSRCRVKMSIVFVPAAGENPDDITGPSSLWVSACEQDTKGIGGGSGRTLAVTNLVGTEAAPVAIPVSAGLLGYSREFVTAADCIEAVFTTGSLSTPGAWVLLTRIQPDAVTLDWDEWDEIRRLFLPERLGPQGSV